MTYLPLEDFTADHPQWPKMHALLGGGTHRSIERKPLFPFGGCYWFSDELAKKLGGEMVPGWRVQWVRGLYVEAVHHGVVRVGEQWLDPHDLQPGGVPKKPGRSLFVEDRSQPLDLRWPVLIENRFVVLSQDEDVEKLILAYRSNNTAACIRRDRRRAILGTTWSVRSDWQGPGAKQGGFFDYQLATTHKQMSELHRKLREKYFPGA